MRSSDTKSVHCRKKFFKVGTLLEVQDIVTSHNLMVHFSFIGHGIKILSFV